MKMESLRRRRNPVCQEVGICVSLLRLISARQFRYNMLNSVEMREVKEKIEIGDKNAVPKGFLPI